MKYLIFYIGIAIMLLSSCNDSTLDPTDNTGGNNYVFYTRTKTSEEDFRVMRLDLETNEEKEIQEYARLIGIANEKIYYYTTALDVYRIESCDKNGENKEVEYTVQKEIFSLPTISKDGRYIQYSYKSQYNNWSANVIDLVTKTEKNFFGSDFQGDATPIAEFSSDSKSIFSISIFELSMGFNKYDILSEKNRFYERFKPAYGHMCGSVSSDNSTFAYLESNQDYDSDIILFDIETETKKQITNDGGRKYNLSWSPDNKKIAFYRSANDFSIINADGSNEVKITDYNDQTPNNWRFFFPKWSEDGSQILFKTSQSNSNIDMFRGDLKIYNTKTKELKTLVQDEIVYDVYFF